MLSERASERAKTREREKERREGKDDTRKNMPALPYDSTARVRFEEKDQNYKGLHREKGGTPTCRDAGSSRKTKKKRIETGTADGYGRRAEGEW